MRMGRMMAAGATALGAYRMYKRRGQGTPAPPQRGRFGQMGRRGPATNAGGGLGGMFGRR